MDAESGDVLAATVTNLRDGGNYLIHEVGPKCIGVDVDNHGNGASKKVVHYVRYVFVHLNETSRDRRSAYSVECGHRVAPEL